MRLHWRGMLRTLDPYAALALFTATVGFQISGQPLEADAKHIMAMIITLALSTHTQVLFGIDGYGAERYRLMPLRGWQILLAKDSAFLAMLALLVAPLDIAAGMLGGIVSLTTGHHVSVTNPSRQAAWRFTEGAAAPWGIVQTILLFASGSALRELGWGLFAGCVGAWAVSVAVYGWVWDRARYGD